MDVRIGVSIMHVPTEPTRRQIVAELLETLGRDSRYAFVEVVEDRDRLGCWPTAKRGWMLTGIGGYTHHLMLQDDVALCMGFNDAIHAAVEANPEAPIAPYSNRAICRREYQEGRRWAVIPDGCWGQAFLMPVPMVREFLAWEAKAIRPTFRWDDSRVALFLLETKRPAWATVPSLVQHLGATMSTVGVNNPKKVAAVWTGVGGGQPWTDGLEDPLRGPSGISRRYYQHVIPKEERHA